MKNGSLAEAQDYNSGLRGLSLDVSLSLKIKKNLQKTPGAFKMVTVADLRRRLETLKCGLRAQETNLFRR